jgi:hypothetical protein
MKRNDNFISYIASLLHQQVAKFTKVILMSLSGLHFIDKSELLMLRFKIFTTNLLH